MCGERKEKKEIHEALFTGLMVTLFFYFVLTIIIIIIFFYKSIAICDIYTHIYCVCVCVCVCIYTCMCMFPIVCDTNNISFYYDFLLI